MPRAERLPEPFDLVDAPDSTEPMSAAELAACIKVLRWSNRDVAAQLQVGDTMVRRMVAGERVIDAALAEWLRTLALAHLRNPAPRILLETAA